VKVKGIELVRVEANVRQIMRFTEDAPKPICFRTVEVERLENFLGPSFLGVFWFVFSLKH
jgi:hypothetical protein